VSDAFDTLCDWIAIPSVTGAEGDYGDAAARALRLAGLDVEAQALEPGRANVLARGAEPQVVFCTHLDTVPPWFGPSRERDVVYGRGACDAKGPLLSMLAAARALLAEGEDRIGFLLTVGEETDSAGAQLASARRQAPWEPRYTIVGEPTDNRWVHGHKGVVKCQLRARGAAGHSSQPGRSAVHELVRVLHALLHEDWGTHALFGRGSINFGLIQGGVAANVWAPTAEASVHVRTVEPPALVEARLRAHLGEHVELVPEKGYGPVEFQAPAGSEPCVVAFGTDAPYLTGWGRPLLYGPGSIADAHTAGEKLGRASFERAVAETTRVARELLASIDAGR
jgi:acetylornithine deacetylase